MEFNPYYKWLGIPLNEQPADYYRLLSIARFESDPDVIEGAADRQMGHVRTFQTGPHSADSQRILNELSAAKLCLLDAGKKAAYDAELKRRLAPVRRAQTAIPIAAPLAAFAPTSPPFAAPAAPIEPMPVIVSDAGPAARAARQRWRIGRAASSWLAVAAVAIPTAIFIGYLIYTKPITPDVARRKPPSMRLELPNKAAHATAVETQGTNPAPRSPTDGSAEPVRLPQGHFVRVELPRVGTLSLAEVEVYSGGRNIARSGKASHSKTDSEYDNAWRAIDGHTTGESPQWTHTAIDISEPWWEVDLGQEHPVESIVVYNRTDCCGDRLEGFTLRVLDADRQTVAVKSGIPAPESSVAFDLKLGADGVAILESTATNANVGAGPGFSPAYFSAAKAPPGTTIDVLKLLKIERDGRGGNWSWDQQYRLAGDGSRMMRLPIVVPSEYDLALTVEGPSLGEVNVILPVAQVQVELVVDGWHKKSTGLRALDGKHFDQNETTHNGALLRDGEPNKLLVQVRTGSIKFVCNSTTVIDWRGDPARLSLAWGKDAGYDGLLVGGLVGACSFSQLDLTPIGPPLHATASILPAAAAVENTAKVQAPPIQAVSDQLKTKATVSFRRNTLEKYLIRLGEVTGIEIVILADDLRKEGITKNQSFGLDEKDQVAGDILRKILRLANPDGKLVYVIKPKPNGAGDGIYVTTRSAAKARGEKLPPEMEEASASGPSPSVDWAGIHVTASHCFRTDTLTALADGRLPTSSRDRRLPRMTWFEHRGTTEWVAYRFDQPQKLDTAAVYWFDDSGRGECRAPQSWRLLWLDDAEWKPVELRAGQSYATALNDLNRVQFRPVKTRGIKLEATLQGDFSGGILEWQVFANGQR